MDALHQLTDADLAALAGALRSGRLHAPFTIISVQRFCATGQTSAIADRLQELHEQGMQPQHLALLVDAVRQARSHVPAKSDLVDLVWTGPETLGITNRDTGVVVRDLFGSAEAEVLVAGFAVYQGRAVFKRLAERMEERPNLRVRLFLNVQRHQGDTTLTDDLLRRFVHNFHAHEWPGQSLPELYYDPRSLNLEAGKRSSLHAKCIVVDRKVALVTSANFTEAAQMRNIEVGALVRSEAFAVQLTQHFGLLSDVGLLRPLSGPQPTAG
ncbi:MAG: phospholipase [Planctomycetia bacterium]|nr:phospholipase [Planctomycetia bacterium]